MGLIPDWTPQTYDPQDVKVGRALAMLPRHPTGPPQIQGPTLLRVCSPYPRDLAQCVEGDLTPWDPGPSVWATEITLDPRDEVVCACVCGYV